MIMTENIGVYCLYFDELDGMYYIGCSSNIHKRILEHKADLLAGRHVNKYLQEAYNKYNVLVAEVLEYCKLSELKDKEIFWIKQFDSYRIGFNQTNGGDGIGYGEGVHNSLYTEEEYKHILKLIVNRKGSLAELHEETGISIHVLKPISSLKTHTWLEQECPEEYAKLRSMYKSKDNSAITKGIVYPSLVSPDGTSYIVTNISAFCREHNLQPQNLHKVLTKQRKVHKGWTLSGCNA